MLLLCTPNSPYSRVVRVAASELNIDLPFEFVGVRERATRLLKFNPAGKVPTLILDDGSVLAEARLICECLQNQSATRLLAKVTDSKGRELEGIVSGFLDGVAVWVREARRDPDVQSSSIMELEATRAERCLQYFENQGLSGSPLNYALISLFSALELMTMRVDDSWTQRFPNLAEWFAGLSERDVFISTRPEIVRG